MWCVSFRCCVELQATHEAEVQQQHHQQEQLEQQQAAMDAKLMGSYALKAYKGENRGKKLIWQRKGLRAGFSG
jgi:hypothetical protein